MSAETDWLPDAFDLEEARAALRASARLSDYRRTPFHSRHGDDLDRWLRAPRVGPPRAAAASPPGRSPLAGETPAAAAPGEDPDILRVGHWNLEKGIAWERLLEAFESEPLRSVDLWSLNEVDVGMARSANRNVIVSLAGRLGFYWAFAANYLELTKGPGADARARGENTVGLHGIALLSRWPLENARCSELPECCDYFRLAAEKRYGSQKVLCAKVGHPRLAFHLATVHLEVRNTPACRARQMERALRALPPGPCWLAGDWNTHTFPRGGILRGALGLLRIVRTPQDKLARELLDPERREPALRQVRESGFATEPWNDGASTARQVLTGVEELGTFPGTARRLIAAMIGGRALRMRLDWISARGAWRPAPGASAWTAAEHGPEDRAASDHAPIGATALWPPEEGEPARR